MAARTQTYANMTGVSVGWSLWESLPPGLEQELLFADCAVIPDQSKHLPQRVIPNLNRISTDSLPSYLNFCNFGLIP